MTDDDEKFDALYFNSVFYPAVEQIGRRVGGAHILQKLVTPAPNWGEADYAFQEYYTNEIYREARTLVLLN